jgi:hypothetical protein
VKPKPYENDAKLCLIDDRDARIIARLQYTFIWNLGRVDESKKDGDN